MFDRSSTLARELLGAHEVHTSLITGYRVEEVAELTGYTVPDEPVKKVIASRRDDAATIEVDEGRLHVVEGDLLLDADEMMVYSLRDPSGGPAVPAAPLGETGLVGIEYDGSPARWDEGIVLRYAVLRASFRREQDYRLAVSKLAAAARDWESVCGVRFEHAAEHDAHADIAADAPAIHDDLVFVARGLDTGGRFFASAFFPTQPSARRKVYFDPTYFTPGLRFSKVGILRHELGHVLGFRHEHIRTGAPPACPGEDTAGLFPFGEYDPQSVMHYFCGGVGDPKLRITDQDREGAQQLYGPPRA